MAKKLTRPILLVGNAPDCADLEYASGFRTPDPVIYLRAGTRAFLVVSSLEYGRALRETQRTTVQTPGRLGLKGKRLRSLGQWALKLLKTEGFHAVTVPPLFPYAVAKTLEKGGIRLHISKGALFPERAVKRPEEIKKLRESQQAAVIAMRAAVAAIARSQVDHAGCLKDRGKRLTSEGIRDLISRVLFDHGCLGREIIVAGGTQGADPHEKGHGPLKAHMPIVIDIFPQDLEHSYWGDLTRTVVKGKPSPKLKRMYQAVKAAQSAALSLVRPGISAKRVHMAAVDLFKRRRFNVGVVDGRPVGFFHSLGHGVGLDIHELPSIAAVEGRLRSGNVITIEPGLYYPDLGGIRIEDTIVVTPHGWRYLAPCEKRFEV